MSAFAVAVPSAAPAPAQDAIRVMVVDDAVVVRGLSSRWIEERARSHASSPRCAPAAKRSIRSSSTIPTSWCSTSTCRDIDGIIALPLLLEKKRDLVVIMASTLTRRQRRDQPARRCRSALPTIFRSPRPNRGVITSATLPRDLIEKIRALGAPRARRRAARPPAYARRTHRAGDAQARAARSSGSASGASPAPADQPGVRAAAVFAGDAARAADRRLDRRPQALTNAGRAASMPSSITRRC